MARVIYFHCYFLVLTLQIVSAQKVTYHIKGKLTGIKSETILLVDLGTFYNLKDKDTVIDSCISIDGAFEFTGSSEQLMLCAIKIPSATKQYRTFILEEGNVSILGDIDSLYKSMVIGGIENQCYLKKNKIEQKYNKLLNSLADSLAFYDDKNIRWNGIWYDYNSLLRKKTTEILAFVKDNKESFVSLLVLNETLLSGENTDTVSKYYSILSPQLRSSTWGIFLKNKIEKTKFGIKTMPVFDVMDVNGRIVNSEKYKGKVTIINFWATWCIPCLEKINELSFVSQMYGNQINIVSISLDTNMSLWKKTIENKQMKWDNLCDGLAGKSPTIINFNIYSIPKTFIVDENGIVLYDSDKNKSSFSEFIDRYISSTKL